MKKLLVIVLVLSMCLSVTSCGKGEPVTAAETPESGVPVGQDAPEMPELPGLPAGTVTEEPEAAETAEPADPEAAEEAEEPEEASDAVEPLPEGGDLRFSEEGGGMTYNFYDYYTEDASTYAVVNAVDTATGETVWNYCTESKYVGQLDNYTVIGLTTAGFVFTVEDRVICLDPLTGSVEWISEPMEIWPTGYYAVDDSCSFYFPGYFTASLVVIDAGGNTIHKYDSLTDIYGSPIEDGWCEGISLREDGYVRLRYNFDHAMTYVIDPETGWTVDEYIGSVSITPGDLTGCWRDNYYSGDPNVILTVGEDLSFALSTYDADGSLMHNYEGYFEIGTFVEEVGNDWIITHLTSTDDPYFQDWDGIGDFVAAYYWNDSEYDGRTMELVQVNNGDSVFTLYFDMYNVILHDFEPVG